MRHAEAEAIPAALCTMVRLADRAPSVVGAKATETAQLLLSGTVFPEQLSAVTVKSLGYRLVGETEGDRP